MPELSWFEDYGPDMFQDYDMSVLQMDEAYLTLKPQSNAHYNLFTKHRDCLNCPYRRPAWIFGEIFENQTVVLPKVPQYLYRITQDNTGDFLRPTEEFICEFGEDFGEFGVYEMAITNDTCTMLTIKEPVSIAFPILTVFLIYLAIFLGLGAIIHIWRRFFRKIEQNDNGSGGVTKKVRIKSLDTFRGISIVLMIFVNYGGGGYEVIEHAPWNGLHIADLVFPWFMWIMGVCIPISLSSSFKRKTPKSELFLTVLKRSVKLFCIGIFLGSSQYLKCMRIFGVLQRFGIAYFIVTTLCIFLMQEENTKGKFADFVKLWTAWMVVAAIFLIHCICLFLVADEGCPRGYLGPGGDHDLMKYVNCTGGATGYIDRLILDKHVYPYPTIKDIYQSQTFDPEGILGCLTSIVHVFIGVQAGAIILLYENHIERLIRWLGWAVVTGLVGGGLCAFSKEDGVIPINKNLWSISFVLVTCSFAFTLLSICYLLIDVKKLWSGKPFLFAGMNAIIMYIGHSMTYGNFPVRWNVECLQGHRTHFLALFENIWGTGVWVLVSYYLYKIQYFFTV